MTWHPWDGAAHVCSYSSCLRSVTYYGLTPACALPPPSSFCGSSHPVCKSKWFYDPKFPWAYHCGLFYFYWFLHSWWHLVLLLLWNLLEHMLQWDVPSHSSLSVILSMEPEPISYNPSIKITGPTHLGNIRKFSPCTRPCVVLWNKVWIHNINSEHYLNRVPVGWALLSCFMCVFLSSLKWLFLLLINSPLC